MATRTRHWALCGAVRELQSRATVDKVRLQQETQTATAELQRVGAAARAAEFGDGAEKRR